MPLTLALVVMEAREPQALSPERLPTTQAAAVREALELHRQREVTPPLEGTEATTMPLTTMVLQGLLTVEAVEAVEVSMGLVSMAREDLEVAES